jgi:hypothetical protein
MREEAVHAVADLLTPDGNFVCSVYNWSVWKQRQSALGIGDNTKKEGLHDTNIYFYNFVADELALLFESAGFELDFVKGLVIPVRGARFIGPLVIPLNRLLSNSSYGRRHGSYLMTRAKVKSRVSAG